MASPIVIAHRGASAAHPPGNTIAAFTAAGPLGATWVELDVRRTEDGALAVHHDPQTTDGDALVHLKAAELPDYVPLLAEALDACAGLGVNIEIKNSEDEPDYDPEHTVAERVVELVRSRDGAAVDQYLISSFDYGTIERVRNVDLEVPTAFLVYLPEPELMERAAADGHRAVHPWHDVVTEETMTRARRLGLAVNVWTVDDPAQIRSLAALGVDGVVTNVPDVAVAALSSA